MQHTPPSTLTRSCLQHLPSQHTPPLSLSYFNGRIMSAPELSDIGLYGLAVSRLCLVSFLRCDERRTAPTVCSSSTVRVVLCSCSDRSTRKRNITVVFHSVPRQYLVAFLSFHTQYKGALDSSVSLSVFSFSFVATVLVCITEPRSVLGSCFAVLVFAFPHNSPPPTIAPALLVWMLHHVILHGVHIFRGDFLHSGLCNLIFYSPVCLLVVLIGYGAELCPEYGEPRIHRVRLQPVSR